MLAAVVGCGKKSNVDTGKLESSFKSAEPATQSEANKAVAAVKAGNYSVALTDLQRLAGKAKLTAEQQQAIKDVIAQVQKAMTDSANKAGQDLKKSLPSK
jgi:hypothetical protein